jgi:hypothetical protein
LTELFNFTEIELRANPAVNSGLVPEHARRVNVDRGDEICAQEIGITAVSGIPREAV